MPLFVWGALGAAAAYFLFLRSSSAAASPSPSASSWTGPIANTMVTGSLTGQSDPSGSPLMQAGFTAPDGNFLAYNAAGNLFELTTLGPVAYTGPTPRGF